jgi:predicted amidohydrolase
MPTFRLALANVPFAAPADESVVLAQRAIRDASAAELVRFPESYVPGYRAPSRPVAPPDADFLERAWSSIAAAAAKGNTAVTFLHPSRCRRSVSMRAASAAGC